MNSITEKKLEQFLDLMNEQFGFYLDCTMGFGCNFSRMKQWQKDGRRLSNLSTEELDQRAFIRGDGTPHSDWEESKKRIKHQTTQGKHKENNSPGGRNFRFALFNCICSIFNEWATFKKDVLGIKDIKGEEREDEKRVPVFKYLRMVRVRLTHNDKKCLKKEVKPFQLTHAPGRYLPGFKSSQYTQLSECHLDDLIAEIRASILKLLPDENS